MIRTRKLIAVGALALGLAAAATGPAFAGPAAYPAYGEQVSAPQDNRHTGNAPQDNRHSP